MLHHTRWGSPGGRLSANSCGTAQIGLALLGHLSEESSCSNLAQKGTKNEHDPHRSHEYPPSRRRGGTGPHHCAREGAFEERANPEEGRAQGPEKGPPRQSQGWRVE